MESTGSKKASAAKLPEKLLIIGISGSTNAGKTTVAQRIVSAYPGSLIVHQDTFFRAQDDPHHEHVQELDHHNWDTVSAVDFDSMIHDIESKLALLENPDFRAPGDPQNAEAVPKMLIIEGILVMNVPRLNVLMDRKFYLTLPKDECWRRRLMRSYNPPDVPGYFDQIVWPMYEKHSNALRKDNNDINFIDGTLSHNAVADIILNDIKAFLWTDTNLLK